MASTSKPGIPEWNISEIKNKNRRTEMYREMKRRKRKAKLEEKKAKMKEEKTKGEKAPPKQTPKTLENMRVYDETVVNPNDEEVLADEATDETAAYHTGQSEPKIMITTCDRPGSRTNKFCKELKKIIPNSTVYYRRGLDLKKIIPQAISHDYTDIIIINENMKIPNGLLVTHLPDGPTADFKLTNVKLSTEVKGSDGMTSHRPEVILNNFSTRLGHSVGRLLASLFNTDPNYSGRRVVTFHNQRDFIFFRQHRSIEDEIEKQSSCRMLRTGSCGLHILHNAFRSGCQAAEWDVEGFLSSLHYLFNDAPARREDFITVTGSRTLPLKFCKHRYEFKNEKKAALKEIGPRFTLKLRSLQKGTFDSKHGQYEWIHKRHEMDTSRRKFYL